MTLLLPSPVACIDDECSAIGSNRCQSPYWGEEGERESVHKGANELAAEWNFLRFISSSRSGSFSNGFADSLRTDLMDLTLKLGGRRLMKSLYRRLSTELHFVGRKIKTYLVDLYLKIAQHAFRGLMNRR